VETEKIPAGEIMALAGIDELTIGDCLTDIEDSRPLPRVVVEEPTIGVTFYSNTGPLAGLDGKPATARDLRMRLERETATNVALRIDPSASTDSIRLFGRGELQIAILIEQMRREGLEMCVSKPEVITKEVDGKVHEPYEMAICDFPEEYMGIVMELMNTRKGRMMQMKHLGSGRLRVEYRVPSRGLVGFRGYYLNDTRGEGLLNRSSSATTSTLATSRTARTARSSPTGSVRALPTRSTSSRSAATCSSARRSRSTKE
jgi:GTP-binding protein